MPYKAVIVGASGLIGRKLLNILLQHPGYNEVVCIGRKKLHLQHDHLKQVVVDFDQPSDYKNELKGHAVFCCLGSTKKKTPDLNEYRKIDHDYPVELAKLAQANDIPQFHLVSSIGADSSSANFYTRMKGQTEDDIRAIGVKALFIYRPSVLTGHRVETRLMETIVIALMKIIDPFLIGKFGKYQSIPAYKVAMAMYKQSLTNQEGVLIYPSNEITKLA